MRSNFSPCFDLATFGQAPILCGVNLPRSNELNDLEGESETARPPVNLAVDGLASYVVSALLWGFGLAWLGGMMGLQMALYRWVSPDRLQPLERLYTRGQIFLTGSRWRAVVDPAIDPKRPYLFFQNHTNHLDHCTMYCATPHFKQGVELAEHFRYPIYGRFMRSRGTISVERTRQGLSQLTEGIASELEQGHSVLLFPEGTRTLTGHLGPFQAGVFRIAQRLGAPIVPVTVTGMYRVMRKGSFLIRPGYDVTVYCDAPVETAGTTRAELPRVMGEVRAVMERRMVEYYATSSAAPSFWRRG